MKMVRKFGRRKDFSAEQEKALFNPLNKINVWNKGFYYTLLLWPLLPGTVFDN